MGHRKTDFYNDCDLSVGSIINIFNRKFVLYDCDEFTKEYYKVKYGISELQSSISLLLSFSVSERTKKHISTPFR